MPLNWSWLLAWRCLQLAVLPWTWPGFAWIGSTGGSSVGFHYILKTDESHRITGATYMLLAALVVFGLFGRTTAVASMLFLSLGDPVAALVGVRMPGPRVFGKSPGGTAAFVAVTWIVVGVLVVSGVTEFHRGLLIGGVVAALVELAPTPLDDNLTVPIAAGLAMHFLGV